MTEILAGRIPLFTVGEIVVRRANTLLLRATRDADGQHVLIRAPSDVGSMQAGRAYIQNEYDVSRRISPDAALVPIATVADLELPFLVFPDSGGRFAHELKQALQGDLAACLTFAVQAAHTLALIHDQGIIHKEIRPENMLAESGKVRLCGFGAASLLSQEQRTALKPDLLLDGGIAYVSPEHTGRTSRCLDQRSDLYSLGVALYELLTGRLPLRGTDLLSWIHSHIAQVPLAPAKFIAGLPEAVSAIVMKLLAKLPEERYQTARGLRHDLEVCSSELDAHGCIADFPLGQRDIPERLMFANRLYGREADVASLTAAFDRAHADSRPHVMLVCGYSGIGKTAVVQELRKPVGDSCGAFASGKFDQYQRAVPYATLVQAVRELVRQLLTRPDEELTRWRQAISQALGTIGRVVTDMIPEVELIIGLQPPIPDLPPAEARNRFNHEFTRFIQVFARRQHPLCLFLDDMQWADSASLELLSSLAASEGTESLFLVLAYRQNEVQPGHPVADFVAKLRSSGVPLDDLVLCPLATGEVAALAAAVLWRPRGECDALARLIVARTLGNPFFVQEFLKTLNRDGLLTFDVSACQWTWDQALVEAEGPTDNVVAMLARTVRNIDPSALATLQLASCFGNEFDLASLSIISQKPAAEVENDLRHPLRQELILPVGGVTSAERRYRFRHDQIRQAAYSLISEEQRGKLHLQIGSLLLSTLSASEREDRLFDIAGQLNLGVEAMADPADRAGAVAVNIAAARKAKSSIAFGAALMFLDCAAKLLGDTPWQAEWATAFALHRERAECLFVTGQQKDADELFQALLQHASARADVAAINILQVRLYSGSSRYDDAIAAGFNALRLFGIDFPDDDASIPSLIAEGRRYLQQLLGTRSLEDMLTAPVTTDPDALTIMGLLGALPPSIYPRRPALFPLIAIRMLQYSVVHGNTEDSCFAYSMYAMLLVGVFGDISGGHALSRMSIQLNERLNDRRHRCTVLHVHANHINYWREPYEENVPFLDRALGAILETGDSAIAGHFSYQAAWQALERGMPFNQARPALEKYAALAGKVRNDAARGIILLQIQLLKNLSGETAAPDALDDAGFSEAAALKTFEATGSNTGWFFYYVIKMIVAFDCGQYEVALRCAESAAPHIFGALALPIETTFAMYRALAVARVLHDGCARQGELTALLDADTEKLRHWAEHCPANFRYKYCLIEAERARLAGDLRAATRLYDEAIESARCNGFAYGAARASELAGGCFASLGLSKVARIYHIDARNLYDTIGARAGVARLDSADPQLQPRKGEEEHPELETPSLDLTSVLRASQAMSREIELGSLLKALIRIVILNAGADRGMLLRFRGQQKVVEVAARTEPDGQISARVAGEGFEEVFPQSVVNYVRRTRERVLIDDVLMDQLFINDPYFAKASVRSVLCAPILKSESLVGLLYLENSVTAGAFTVEKLAALDLLSSQAAISLENADLYRVVRQSEERLRMAHDAAHSGTWEWDPQTGENVWSEELWKVYGLEPYSCQPSYEAWTGIVHPDDRAQAIKAVEEAARNGTELNVEFRVRDGDGKERWLMSRGRPLRESEGRTTRIGGIVLDITERKQAEKAVRETSALLEAILNSIPIPVMVSDPAGNVVRYNKALQSIYHIEENAIEGYGSTASLTTEDGAEVPPSMWPISRVLRGEKINNLDLLLTYKNETRNMRYFGDVIRDPNGAITHGVLALLDVTDKKRAERELRNANAQLEAILEAIPEPVTVSDSAGKFILSNAAFKAVIPAEPNLGDYVPYAEFRKEDGQVVPTEEWPLNRAIRGERLNDLNLWLRFNDAPARLYRYSTNSIRDGNGKLTHAIVCQIDITDRNRAEERLRASEEKFAKAFAVNPAAVAMTRVEDGLFVEVNAAWEAMTGYHRDEVAGQLVKDSRMWPAPEDRVRFTAELKQNGAIQGREQTFLKKSGAPYTALFSAVVVGVGGEEMVVSTLVDTTERKRAEASMRESRAKLEAALASMTDAVFISDVEGRLIEFNDAFATFHRFRSKAACARTFAEYPGILDVFFPDGTPAPVDMWAVPRALRGETVTNAEYRLRRKDTGEAWIGGYSFAPIRDASGAVVGSVVVGRDITEWKRTEEALRLTQASVDGAAEMVAWFTPDGRVHYANDATCRTLQYSREELLQMTALDFSPGMTWEQYQEHWAEVRNRKSFTVEVTHRRKDGAEYPAEVLVNHIVYGGQEYIFAYGRDIAERKQAEQALQRSEIRFRGIFENSAAGIILCDWDGNFLESNDAFRALLGYGRDELGGRHFSTLIPPADLEMSLADVRRLKSGEVPYFQNESRYLRKDGQTVWVHKFVSLIPDTTGKMSNVVVLVTDITERKRAEAALAESEHRYRSLFESMQEAFMLGEVLFDEAGKPCDWRYLDVNPYFEAIYGRKREEVVGKTYRKVLPGAHSDDWIEIAGRVTVTGKGETFASKSNAGLYLEGTVYCPRPGQFAAIVTDATARREAEEQIRRLNAELEQRVRERTAQLEAANKELESFAYSVSHDLRAPLRGIDGWSLALAEDYADQFDERAHQYLERVRSETQRMGLLIDDMLQLSRVTRTEMRVSDVDLTSAARRIAAELSEVNPSRRIEFVIEPNLSGVGDARLLDIALTNLLGNAVKFTGPRAIARIEFGRAEQNGETAFYVRDNGVGFDMAYAGSLFGAFQRLHKASEFPGTGIGLATVQRVIHRHGGRLWTEAQVDRGATFYFTILENP